MTQANVENLSLWRETWREFKASAPVWWPWVLGAAVIFAFIVLASFTFGGATLSVGRDNVEALKENSKLLTLKVITEFLSLIVNILCVYVFTVLYLRYAVKKNPPEFGFGNFFYWLGRVVAKYAVVLGPVIIASVIIAVIASASSHKGSDGDNAFSFVFAMILAAAFIFAAVAAIRLMLVTPLAIFRRKPVLKRSWNLTLGNWWRIFGNSLMLMLILFVLMIVGGIAFVIIAMFAGGNDSMLGRGLWGLFMGLFSSGTIMLWCIFTCTVYRVLLREQRETAATPPSTPAL